MKYATLVMAALLVAGSQIACCTITLPEIPEIEINVPTIQVGEMQDKEETIPISGAESATVEILFGAGELEIETGISDDLCAGRFRYNVAEWEPEVTYEDNVLTIEQGGIKEDWGVPTGNTTNEWKLEFSPEIPLKMSLDVGAGDGELDFTGLQLTELDLDMGAGNFYLRFDEPNKVTMSDLELNTGASKLDVTGIGNAGPERVRVQGGVGDITLDLGGDWPHSSDVEITAGVGAVTLRLPDDVGVRVETEGGLTNVETDGLQRRGGAYVNDVFGEVEIELHIRVTTGIGNLRLIEMSND